MGNTPSWPFVCLYLARRCEVPSSVTKSNPSQNSHLTKPLSRPHMFIFHLGVVKRYPAVLPGMGQHYRQFNLMQSKNCFNWTSSSTAPWPAVLPDARVSTSKVNCTGVGSYFPPRTNSSTAASLHLLSGRHLLQPDSELPC